MSRNWSITEPHPSVPTSGGYIAGGRGGAGNYKRYVGSELTSGPAAAGPASSINLSVPFKRGNAVSGGRGGAGNMFRRAETEERVFQFDEEMKHRRENQTPVYHIGRGGAANWVADDPTSSSSHAAAGGRNSSANDVTRSTRMNSTGSAGSVSSRDSADSAVRSAIGRISRKFS